MNNKQIPLMRRDSFPACRALGCTGCAGDLGCPCHAAYLERYGTEVNHAATADLAVWFPRQVEIVTAAATTTKDDIIPRLEEAHDRLVDGGYAAGRERELAKKKRYENKHWHKNRL